MNKVLNFSIGADPELFLERNGEIISAEGLIGGTKDAPKPISDRGHAIQEDNVMVEYNIPPTTSAKQFIDEHNFVLEYLKVLASLLDGAELNFSASANLDRKYLTSEQAKTFGCEPDFNVWLKKPNLAPKSSTKLRTCGGHIHVGYDDPTIETSERIVKAMDVTLGLESILIDEDDRRKDMYGKAGAFRFKNYGVEYRTLSNFWISNENLMEWAFLKTEEAIELVNSGVIDSIDTMYGARIQEAINNNNKEEAANLIIAIEKVVQTELIKK